jgi:hypothetical protein
MEDLVTAVQNYGFPVVAMVGLGYFVYFVWTTINEEIDPAIEELHMTLIRLIDQVRMLDNDMIRLQEKVNTALHIRDNEKKNDIQVQSHETKKDNNDAKRN